MSLLRAIGYPTDLLQFALCYRSTYRKKNIGEPVHVIWNPTRSAANKKKIPQARHNGSVKT